jgi:hypothetical protein
LFLDTMATEAPGKRGGSCSLSTKGWHHIEPVYLPSCSLDFNPIEWLWQHLKSHHLQALSRRKAMRSRRRSFRLYARYSKPGTIRSVCHTHFE